MSSDGVGLQRDVKRRGDMQPTRPSRRGRHRRGLGAAASQTRAGHEGLGPSPPQPRFWRSVTWLATGRLNSSIGCCPHTSAVLQSVFDLRCQVGMQRSILRVTRKASGCRTMVKSQHVSLHPPCSLAVLPSPPQAPSRRDKGTS